MSEHFEAKLSIPQDHPALPGHFPGAPVVPGVLLLDALIEAAEARLGRALRVVGVPRAKFLAPLLPGPSARAVLALEGERLGFIVRQEGRLIAEGTFALSAEPAP
ncbi:MAG TPA: hypothetical protein VMU67_16095 [Steroidobacteraceae bacterium]|nr:hypothetical protein [Steroidobacteraceae bacterium]